MKYACTILTVLLLLLCWSQSHAAKPTITVSPRHVNTTPFNLTITFSENVNGFAKADVGVSGGNASVTTLTSNAAGDVYTAAISVDDDYEGTVFVEIEADVATTDANEGNEYRFSSVTVDKTAPTMTFRVVPDKDAQNGQFSLYVTFNEVVSGFDAADLSFTTVTGDASGTVDRVALGSPEWRVYIRPSGEGDLKIVVRQYAVTDRAGNSNASGEHTVTIDSTHPTVSIDAPSSVTQAGTFDVIVEFSEPVTGFVQSDLNVNGSNASGTITTWTPENSSAEYNSKFTASITPMHTIAAPHTRPGNLFISVNQSVAQDAAQNLNQNSALATIKVDLKPPTVTLRNVPSVQSGRFNVFIDFSEDVTGFDANDLTISGVDAAVTLTGSGSSYGAVVTPDENITTGTLTIQVPADAAHDDLNHGNEASPVYTVSIDQQPPTVTITGPSGVQNQPFDVTITFSEEVTGFGGQDILLILYNEPDDIDTTLSGSGATYTLNIDATGEGRFAVFIPAGGAYDAAQNRNEASNQLIVNVDTVRPTVTIDVPSRTQNSDFSVMFEFNEPVTGFTQDDIVMTFTDTADASITDWVSRSDGTLYTATIEPSGKGGLEIQIPANAAADAGNNGNVASTKQTVQIDTVGPTVTIDVPANSQNGPFDVTITFSENVTGFTVGDIELTGTGTVTAVVTLIGSGTTYTATISPSGEGELEIEVPTDAAFDDANNGNVEAVESVRVDTVRPTVELNVTPDPVNNHLEISITFSEAVTGFEVTDIAIGGTGTADATVSRWSGSDQKHYGISSV